MKRTFTSAVTGGVNNNNKSSRNSIFSSNTSQSVDSKKHPNDNNNANLRHTMIHTHSTGGGGGGVNGGVFSNSISKGFFSNDNDSITNRDSMKSSSSHKQLYKFLKKINIYMYNYGSPRVGNNNFAQLYNKLVLCSYRICVDGDIVPALPPPGKYYHIGTEILIDSVGAGSIIIDPSFVEVWLRTHMKSSVAVHSLLVYRRGLLGEVVVMMMMIMVIMMMIMVMIIAMMMKELKNDTLTLF